LVNWANCLIDATARACRPIAYNTETGATLKMTGFVEIQEQIFKVPLNPWPNDLHLKDIGKWYNLGLTQGLEAFTLGPMTRVMNWTKGDVDRLVVEAKKDICSQKYHTFCNM
jgi:hypothetical protein